ncbi:acetyl-CoA carboxylase biotin carboxylase subunit family protein [Bacteroides fragilis]
MRKKIAIIGGSYLQLPAVLKAHKLGLEVHCFSWEEGAVCAEYADYFYPISILEKERILSVCREIGVDGVMTIASDVAVITVNYVAKRLGLVSNPEEYSLITTDKYFMRQCFSKNQLPSPRFCLATIQEYDIAHFSYPLIVKPTDRSGSRGVEKVYSRESVAMAVERACSESFTHTAIIEEYIGGREVSVESISFDGCHYVLAVTDKITTGAPFFC